MDYMENRDPNGVARDLDDSTYINTDMDIEEHTDIDEIDFDKFSDTKIDADNDLNLKLDISSVTDTKYFINNEKIRIIF
jgi:hypothetical protein